ncbi:uncharacterized protein LOC119401674 [Rhipicephalus sanguineus]|uniref:uncharacterized protein LOC119401674 n=1 Tax=Rhipicephalus sanguineus TaxID=34632 RepID=UPI001895B1BE|nr:uncharacterized protein LOC119401674 [Rhipicephalus sanguineus]
MSRMLFNVTLRATLWICFLCSFHAARLKTPGRLSLLKYLPGGREAVVFCGEVGFFFYDMLVYGVVTRCSEVLVQYLKREVARLEVCYLNERSSEAVGQSSPAWTVAIVRGNVCKIKALKASLNDLCGPSIVISTACLLMYSCVNMYRYFILNQSQVHLWLPLVYMTYCAFCLADMAFVSEDLGREAIKLKDTAKGLAIEHPTNEYLIQVRYLHNIIEPEDMCLTGGNFFRLDSGLLVTVTGAVITFGVILVQTGRDLSHQSDLSQGNVSTFTEGQSESFNCT